MSRTSEPPMAAIQVVPSKNWFSIGRSRNRDEIQPPTNAPHDADEGRADQAARVAAGEQDLGDDSCDEAEDDPADDAHVCVVPLGDVWCFAPVFPAELVRCEFAQLYRQR